MLSNSCPIEVPLNGEVDEHGPSGDSYEDGGCHQDALEHFVSFRCFLISKDYHGGLTFTNQKRIQIGHFANILYNSCVTR